MTAHRFRSAMLGGLMLAGISLPVAAEESADMPRGVIQLDETVISGNQELPKVLYILPWRDPNGLPDVELDASYSEMDVFRRLYPPAYRRELTYFESLETNSPEAKK
ncbi:MAG: hypothetical protein EP301_02995 [Gammaproteobacteria bacterium]|nr:MAG: hypothetical protein EP301_02995 [Gammaproteobacteria bacterium]